MTQASSGHLLFLQGPLGPFFRRLANVFSHQGYTSYKINFNAGDRLFGGADHTSNFSGSAATWPVYLEQFITQHKINAVFLMGDCRSYHRQTKVVCKRLGVRVLVFEEGYLRPDTITLEEYGVNAFSNLNLTHKNLQKIIHHSCKSAVKMGPTMRARGLYAAAYYWAALLGKKSFPYYQHHRDFHPVAEGAKWIRGFARKLMYRKHDFNVEENLQTSLSGKFYLVALQVHDDSQMRFHSPYASVEDFITETVHSFSSHAPEETVMVLKHHPMDRGYTHYGEHIRATG